MGTIEFLGVGAATDFSQGQTSVLYRGRQTLLVDCGPQVPAALTPKLSSPDELDGIYVTHRHADHCFGLGSLLLWHRLQGRERPLVVFSEAETLRQLTTLLELGYPGAFAPDKCFPLELRPLQVDVPVTWGYLRLRIAETRHNVKNCALRIDDESVSLVVSGDGLVTEQTMALYAGCDWIVQECAYVDLAHDSHMSLPRVLAMRDAVHPKGIFLTHCLAEQRERIEAAVQGLDRSIRVVRSNEVISV